MNFDHQHVIVFGYTIFEPMTVVTNTVIFFLATLFYGRLRRFGNPYARHMSLFILFLGISTLAGALAHGVQYQMGSKFLYAVVSLTFVFSSLSALFCFLPAYYYSRLRDEYSGKVTNYAVLSTMISMIASIYVSRFAIVKIIAGGVLLYSLFVHISAHKKTSESGNKLVIIGILVAFVPIIVHTLKISAGVWMNHKDISHIIMIFSLTLIYQGTIRNAQVLDAVSESPRKSLEYIRD